MARLPARAFREAFVAWTQDVAQIQDGEVVAIDGKRLRRSYDHRNGRAALHAVSVWANEQQVTLGQGPPQRSPTVMAAVGWGNTCPLMSLISARDIKT
jgi:hypothetical protein